MGGGGGELEPVPPRAPDSHVWPIKDQPRLAEKLREQGWIVKRVGDELDCQPRRPWSRVQ